MKNGWFALLLLFLSNSVWSESLSVTSPDGHLKVQVSASGIPTYDIKYKNQPIIAPSQLGFIMDYQTVGDKPQSFEGHLTRSAVETYRLPGGKSASVTSPYNELVIKLRNAEAPALDWHIIFRVFNDGVAFRYYFPSSNAFNTFTLQWELSQFRFADDFACFGLNLGKFANGHEGEFDPINASKIRTHHLFDSPLVCKTGHQDHTFALAQANLVNYAGAYFTGLGDGGLGVQVQLTPRFDEDKSGLRNVAVKGDIAREGFATPWRVMMFASSPLALIESNLITTLAEPSKLKDSAWVKPGKVAWDWWNDNQVAIDKPGMNTETYKAYTDFAATLGLEYILIDAGWYEGSSFQSLIEADVTKQVADINIEEIVDYAASKGVGVWLWVQWQQLDRQMLEALRQYQRWNIKGIKVDFMDRFDQEIVDYYHKLLALSAEHKLMVNLHGAFAPTGLARTYPNFLTQEGVLGAEYNKWSSRVTATHNVTLPFTRMLLGPMDYTPGGFRHIAPEAFSSHLRNTLPFVQTTRGQALAMYVVFESPLQMLSDSPMTYSLDSDGPWPKPKSEWQPGLEFIASVPVAWDETRALQGQIGEFIAVARRKGDVWYLGAMTNEQARTLEIPLNFLTDGDYSITTWQDGDTLSSVNKETVKGTPATQLTLRLKPSGGAAAIIKPLPKGSPKN